MRLHENIVTVLIVMIRHESNKFMLDTTYNFYSSLPGSYGLISVKYVLHERDHLNTANAGCLSRSPFRHYHIF